MANTIIAASLTLDSGQATQSVKSFRQQLKEATNDLITIQEKFGETSAEAIAAAKGVAALKASIKDAKEVSDLFNPETKFAAFAGAVRASAGGITALTGAMALFGDESKEVQQALLKVQGALALTEGLNTLADAAKDFTRLKTVAVDAFNSIKVAIGSTGIGAIVIAVGLLVTYWDDIRAAIGLSTAEQRKYLEETTKSTEQEKVKLDLLTSQDNILKQQGKSEQDILAIKNKQIEATIKASLEQLKAQKAISDQAIATAVGGQNVGPGLGLLTRAIYGDPKKVAEENKKANDDLALQIKKLQDQLAANQLQITKSTSDFNAQITALNQAAGEAQITDAYVLSQKKLKDSLEAQKQQYTIEYTNLQQRNSLIGAAEAKYASESAALAKKYAKDKADALRKIAYDTYITGLTDQRTLGALAIKQQLSLDIEAANYEISNLQDRQTKIAALTKQADAKIADLRAKDLLDFQTKYNEQLGKNAQAEVDALSKSIEETVNATDNIIVKSKETLFAETANLNKEIATMNLDAAGQQAAASLEQLNKWYDEKQKALKGNAEAELALTKEYERQKTQITQIENDSRLEIISGALNAISELIGQQSVAGKALGVASAIIDTYVGATKALAQGGIFGFIGAAAIIAAGLSNVKKILSVQIPNASGANSGSTPSISGANVSAPLQPQAVRTSTALPQDQINSISNATTRAYIVEADIKDSGERVSRLNRAARLGN